MEKVGYLCGSLFGSLETLGITTGESSSSPRTRHLYRVERKCSIYDEDVRSEKLCYMRQKESGIFLTLVERQKHIDKLQHDFFFRMPSQNEISQVQRQKPSQY